MEYEIGIKLDRIEEAQRDAAIERALIIKVLEKVHPVEYKVSMEDIRKEIDK